MMQQKTILELLGNAAPNLARSAWDQALREVGLDEKTEYSIGETLRIALAIAQNLQKQLEDLALNDPLAASTPHSPLGEAGIVEQFRNC